MEDGDRAESGTHWVVIGSDRPGEGTNERHEGWKIRLVEEGIDVMSVFKCVHVLASYPILANLQSRCDLKALVSVTTFYCLQACEQGLLFGRGLNSKSNKLRFFLCQWFLTVTVFFSFPDRRAEGGGRGGGQQRWRLKKVGKQATHQQQKDGEEQGSTMMGCEEVKKSWKM